MRRNFNFPIKYMQFLKEFDTFQNLYFLESKSARVFLYQAIF